MPPTTCRGNGESISTHRNIVPWEPTFPSLLGVITHILGLKTFILHGFGVQGYGIFTYTYHKNQHNVGKYAIHGSYGLGIKKKWIDKSFPLRFSEKFKSPNSTDCCGQIHTHDLHRQWQIIDKWCGMGKRYPSQISTENTAISSVGIFLRNCPLQILHVLGFLLGKSVS